MTIHTPILGGRDYLMTIPISPASLVRNDCSDSEDIDPRFVFLAQASARYDLVQLREMDLDEAFEGLVPAFKELIEYESDFDRLVEQIAKQNKARRPAIRGR
jgi:hypothetical protein